MCNALPRIDPCAHRLATRAVRGGTAPDPSTGAIVTPIYQTATFVQPALGEDRGYTYSRTGNPTVAALEARLAALEGDGDARCFATGMAALTALLLAELSAGDHVVVGDVVYGGTVRLLRDVLGRFGVRASFVDATDAEAVARAVTPRTRLIVVETPANPTLALTDLGAVAAIAARAGATFVVDNTFLTAALQRPYEFGADVVLYSTTKYVEGHNTTVGGALLSRDESLISRVDFIRNAAGMTQSPFDAWLTLRGLATLPMRMAEHSRRALEVARWLESRDDVERVIHPDLESFPQHDLTRRQHGQGSGGVIAFEPAGGVERARALLPELELCALAESLGAVETLVTHPATMTHGDVPGPQRLRAGITDSLIRLSVGLEDPQDIIADLDRALTVTRAGVEVTR